jgi:hypothetical protein
MKNLRFSLFGERNNIKGSKQTTPTKQLSFKELLAYYNSNENRELSIAILNEKDSDKQKDLKNKRAYYTPSGTFTTRKNEAITHHNNIISIDIDNLKSENEAIEIKNKLATHKSTLFCCLSVRGKGVKALMLVDKTYTPGKQYQQLKNVFKPYLTDFLKIDSLHIDTAQFVLSQPCYFSWDNDFYTNEKAEKLELEFNYKEAARPEFQKVLVPLTATSRIEKYILTILKNKLETLTPEGARHPKLYAAKGLGELIHYAPHLESEIISSFIDGGVAMYGKESMRSNVTDSVLKAFNGGKMQPINNTVIDSIIEEQKPARPQNTNVQKIELNGNYLSEDKSLVRTILKTIDSTKYTIIDAPTGTGKTTLFAELSDKFNTLFFVPLRTIAQQQIGDYPIIIGETTEQEIELSKNYPLVFSTYASSHKIKSAKGKVVVIDESHLLSDRSNILYKDLVHLTKLMSEASKVIFLSATTNNLLREGYPGAKQINIFKREAAKIVTPLFCDSKVSSQQDSIIDFVKANINSGVSVVFVNDKGKLESIQNDLIKLGVLKFEQIAKFTSNPFDIESDNYTNLIETQTIQNNIKLILATSKIGEGVNIKNKEQFNILSVGLAAKDTNFFRQSIGRFRGAEILNISTLFGVEFKKPKGSYIDELRTYNNYEREAKSLSFDSELMPTDENSYLASFDWNERAVINPKGYNKILNCFELMHQAKQLKESFYNFEIWSKELSQYNIEFLEPEILGANKNEELKDVRAERKEIKNNYLEEVRSDIFRVIPEVYRTTKNNKLKGYLREYVYADNVKLSTNELILFHSNFDKIEKYISEVMTLSCLTDLDFRIVSKDYFENENYKNFEETHKQLTYLEIDNREARTQQEISKKQRIDKIKATFKGVQVISKVDLIGKLRKDLNYKLSKVSNEVLKKQISGIFETDYNKKTKEFTLRLVEKEGTFKSSFLYKQYKKKYHKEPLFKGAAEPKRALLSICSTKRE